MFPRRRRPAPSDDAVSPWSSEANAPDAPPLTWDTPPPSGSDPGDDASADSDPPEAGPSRTGWVAAALVAAVTLAGLVWLWPSNVDDGADADAAPDDPPVTTLGTLPPPTTVVDAPTSEERDEALREQAEAEASVEAEAGGTGSVQRPSVPDIQMIELPDGFPEFAEPFELVMTTERGLATLSLPSGTLRTTPLAGNGGDFFVEGLIVAPDSTFVGIGDGAVIVDRSGSVTDVDLGELRRGIAPIGWSNGDDGETVFRIGRWSEFGALDTATVSRAGTLGPDEDPPAWPFFVTADGSQLLNDAGGIYRIASDGATTQIAEGTIIGIGTNHLGLRTCDEQRDCSISTLDLTTGEELDFADSGLAGTNVVQRFGTFVDLASVSPDGTMMVTSSTLDEDGTFVDLLVHADGSTVAGGIDPNNPWPWASAPAWAPDSSGVFSIATSPAAGAVDLRFVSATGEQSDIDGLPRPTGWIGVRSIDAELPAIETGSLGIDPVPDIDVGIVGLDRGAAVHIDLAAGSMATWATPDVGAVPDLFHVDTAVIGVSSDGDVSFRSFAGTVMDSRKDPIDPPGSPRYQGSDDRLVWRPDAAGGVYELVPMPFHDVAGRNAWQTIEVGSDAVYGTNGAGGLVYEQGGDIFVSDASGPQRLTSGELVAIGPTTALVHECDDTGACGNVLVDAEGERTPTVGPPGVALPIEPRSAVDGSISPDGEAMFVRLPANPEDASSASEEDREWAFVDWQNVSTYPAPAPDLGAEVHWTADGRYAFYLADDRIHMFDRDGRRIEVLDGAGDFDVITLVPLEFTPDTAAD